MLAFIPNFLFQSHDHSSHHKLLQDVEERDCDTDQGGVDQENERVRKLSMSQVLGKWHARLWLWGYLQAGLTVAAILLTWRLTTPSPTSLREEILTADHKSFPSGPLLWSQTFKPLPCGRTPAEALARGCHFDIIATAWLPPNCIDNELVAEFAGLYPWQYFSHRNGTSPFPNDPDILGAQAGLIWTTDRWHAAHCLYMWKKLNRAIVRGWMTDAETITQSHTDHCTRNIMNMDDPEAIRGIMEVIYPPC